MEKNITTNLTSLPLRVRQYLEKYSFRNWNIESSRTNNISTVIIIPAIMEYDNIQKLLASLAENNKEYFGEVMVLFVINNMKSSSQEIKCNNAETIALLRRIINKNNEGNEFIREIMNSGLRLAFIDTSSEGNELPEKDGGVGLARKIGMDLALQILDYTSVKKKILVCLDSDCTVSQNYLFEIINNFNEKRLSAAVVNYDHKIQGGESAAAILCYEIFLRYYVLGLQYANSHYAFHTIGSTIACDYESYIKAEGMNKKKAAEDFYFLEKLAKTTKVGKIISATVYPSGRKSWRVPFGTGQRVSRFLSGIQNEYLLYHPESFIVLKKWLEVFNSETRSTDFYLDAANQIKPALKEFLEQQKFPDNWSKIINNVKDSEQINKQKIFWFDGFKTLKLIHYLRDNYFPLQNMFDAVDKLLNYINSPLGIKRTGDVPSLEIQEKYLTHLRNLTS